MKSIKDTLQVLKSVIEEFNEERSSQTLAALIGGHAVIYFGVPRTTLDVDICLYDSDQDPGPTAYAFLRKKLSKRFSIRFFQASKDQTDPLKHDLIVIDDTEGAYPRIDILIARYQWELSGLEQAEVSKGLSFPVMPIPHLIAMKLMAGGRKEELDILELLKGISENDLPQIRELAKKVGKGKKLKELLTESGCGIL